VKFAFLGYLLATSLFLAGCSLAGDTSPAAQVLFTITLSPADFDRAAEVVNFTLPAGLPHEGLALQPPGGNNGAELPLQVESNGWATAQVPFQKAGQALTYDIKPSRSTSSHPQVTLAKEEGRLRFEINNKPVFYYQMDLAKPPRDGIATKILRGAFLYPIYTPKGVQMSDSYPVDHPHDHGIWTAWASSKFQGHAVDFWNPHYPDGGTVEFAALDRTWEGNVDAGFESRHRFMDRNITPPIAALNEKWKVTLFAAPGVSARVFDLEFTQTPATADPLEVEKYIYGGLGMRGHAQWEDKSNLWILTSEGTTDRVLANNQPARWFFMGGNVDGVPAGIAVLSAPTNFRAPQTVRMNPDGPFFMYAPVITGGFTISKEQPYLAHYRFIVQDGPPDAKFLEACWQGLAHPAMVLIVAH